MSKKQKLELTWIGKENRPKLEPRILLEDPAKSYHAKRRVASADIFDNRLIFGDNLLALKALEAEFAGAVKLVYIDPPFNTGAAFDHYDDGVEHSIWLSLMRHRFESLRTLLRSDGFLFVHLDDNEAAYCKVLLDEVFGRANYVNQVVVATNKPFGFKGTSDGIFKQANHIFVYAKDKLSVSLNAGALFVEKGYDQAYKWEFYDQHLPEQQWKWRQFDKIVAQDLGYATPREARKQMGDSFDVELGAYAIKNADRVFRTAAVSGGALLKRKDTISKSRGQKDTIVRHPNDDMDYMFIGGERVLYYKERLKEIDGSMLPGELITDIWTDIPVEGLASEGGVEFPKGKKPEKLLQRIISLTTNRNDLVLDSFAGSGTTGAVAHKMGRRWIMIELGEHCHSHTIPRLQKVIDGADPGGITEAVGWKGGGGFRYYRLAPSLLEKDKWGNWVINHDYNAAMLAEALCKLEGFSYAPSDAVYWQHGHSTERDFVYVTTASLTHEQLQQLSDEVGPDRSLLVLCTAFRAKADAYPNLTVKKIPKQVLSRCEWGHDDYSLQVENLPKEPPKPGQQGLFDGEGAQ